MVGANDGITADTLCVCQGCGQLAYGAQLCGLCVIDARRHAARAAAMFSQQSRINGNAVAAAEYERARRKCLRFCAVVVSAGVALMLWGLFGGQ